MLQRDFVFFSLIIMQLTEEQRNISKIKLNKGEAVKVLAFAGTGKSTTVAALCRETLSAASGARILCLCFNREMCEDLKAKVDPRVCCKTWHGLAWSVANAKGSVDSSVEMKSSVARDDVKKILSISNTLIRPVLDTLQRFLHSAQPSVTVDHVPQKKSGKMIPRQEVASLAQRLFRHVSSPDSSIGYSLHPFNLLSLEFHPLFCFRHHVIVCAISLLS